MVNIDQKFIKFITSALNQENETVLMDSSEWSELIKIIINQGLFFPLYSFIKKYAELNELDILPKKNMDNQIVIRVAHQLQIIQHAKNIIVAFKSADIPVIAFKGLSIARFYSQPEYRLMTDLDILVQEKDRHRAQCLIESMGYIITKDKDKQEHDMHYGYQKRGALYLELHTSLLCPRYLGVRDMNKWYQNIWERSKIIKFENLEFLGMAEEDELINQILHFATHLTFGTSHFKHIYDMALMIKCCGKELNWQYLHQMLETLKLLVFGKLIFTVCNKHFKIDIPEDFMDNQTVDSEKFLDLYLNSFSVEKEEGDSKAWDALISRYTFVCKNPGFYPLIWFSEMFVQVRIHKWKIVLCLKKSWQKTKIFIDKLKTLEKLGLKG